MGRERSGGSRRLSWSCVPQDSPIAPQLEDLEVTIADHIQEGHEAELRGSLGRGGDEFQKEETFTLSTIKTLEGKCWGAGSGLPAFQDPWPLLKCSSSPVPACPPKIQGQV